MAGASDSDSAVSLQQWQLRCWAARIAGRRRQRWPERIATTRAVQLSCWRWQLRFGVPVVAESQPLKCLYSTSCCSAD